MMAAKVAYIVMSGLGQIVGFAGGAWLTYLSGQWGWLFGGIVWCAACSYGFTQRVNSWGDMGQV